MADTTVQEHQARERQVPCKNSPHHKPTMDWARRCEACILREEAS